MHSDSLGNNINSENVDHVDIRQTICKKIT